MTGEDSDGDHPDIKHADHPKTDPLWHPRGELCVVCLENAHGFGWYDPHTPRDERQFRWFCSMQCQSAFMKRAGL